MMDTILFLIAILYPIVTFILILLVKNSANVLSNINEKKFNSRSKKTFRLKKTLHSSFLIHIFYNGLVVLLSKHLTMFIISWFLYLITATVFFYNLAPRFINFSENVLQNFNLIDSLNFLNNVETYYLYSAIDWATNIFGLLVSLGLTVAIFVYREQRLLSHMNHSLVRKSFMNFSVKILHILVFIVFGKITILKIDNCNGSATCTNFYEETVIIGGLLFLLSIYFLIKITKNMIDMINIEQLLTTRMRNFHEDLIIMSFVEKHRNTVLQNDIDYARTLKNVNNYFMLTTGFFKRQFRIKTTYKMIYYYYLLTITKLIKAFSKIFYEKVVVQLRYTLISIYQLLIVSLDKNMTNVFSEGYENWRKIGVQFQSGLDVDDLKTEINAFEIFRERWNNDDFNKFYRALLDGHLSLIQNLIQKKKLDSISDGLEFFFEPLSLSQNFSSSLKSEYISKINTLLLSAYYEDSIEYKRVLKYLDILCDAENENRKDYYAIYVNLLYKLIEEDDVINLTTTSYSLLPNPVKEKLPNEKTKLETKISEKVNQNLKEVEAAEILKRKEELLWVFIKLTVKSIEVSSTKSTGFFVKFLVTNFNSHLSQVIEELKNSSHDIKGLLESKGQFTNSSVHFEQPFNQQTSLYCVNKLTYMLYLQQKYARRNRLEFIESWEDFEPISKELVRKECKYVNYLKKKLNQNKEKYGLLALEKN